MSSMPAPVARTSTVTVHVAPIANKAKPAVAVVMTLVPGTAVSGRPVQVVDALAGSAISIPVGRLSVNPRRDTGDPLRELSMVNVKVLLPPSGTVDGAKLLENPGRSVATVKSSVAVPLSGPLEVRTLDVFVCAPGVPAVTSTLTVHVSPPPSRPSLKVIVPPPAGAVTTPSSQVVAAFAGVAMSTSPGTVGRVSVKARSVTGVPVPLVIVNVSVETEPGPIVSGAKTLLNAGGSAAAPF